MKEKSDATFRIHVGLVLAEIICWSAFIFEVKRAISGNTLSWAYVFEWPILGLYAIYMWKRLLREERGEVDEEDGGSIRARPHSTRGTSTSPRVHQNDRPSGHDGDRDKLSD